MASDRKDRYHILMTSSQSGKPKLAELMTATASMIRADFERSRAIKHRGEIGTVREKILIADLLADYLPGRVRVSPSCEIVDSNGNQSPQVDVAIYDPSAPTLYRYGDFRIFPAECMYGTIEVKTELTEHELKRSIENARKVKQLKKTEFHWELNGTSREYNGRSWNHCHTVCYLFAYRSSDIGRLASYMSRYYAEHEVPGEERLDGVWVLGEGMLCWVSATSQVVVPFPENNDYLAALAAYPEQDVLLTMIVLLNSHFSTAWMPPFRMNKYAGSGVIGSEIGLFRDGVRVKTRSERNANS